MIAGAFEFSAQVADVGINASVIRQETTTEGLPPHREAPALGVAQPQPAPTELLAQDAVLFLQVADDVLLLAVGPANEEKD